MDKLLKYYNGDDFIAGVWQRKYAAKGEETPDDMHRRLAKKFATIRYAKNIGRSEYTLEMWENYFYEMFKDFKHIIPQGRIMAGLGIEESYRSLSNCLRLPPPKDSYSSIMFVDTMLVSAAKRGCGYGLGLSHLRPSGAATTNAANTSTGVTTFGNRFSNSTHEVGQQGRRGACLEDLDIRHPESPTWAVVKLDKQMITGANISFKIWNDFMLAVENNQDYILRFPVDLDINQIITRKVGELGIIGTKLNPVDLEYDKLYSDVFGKGTFIKKIKAKELWNASIHGVWADGCPGLQFWERIVNYDPCSVYKKYEIDGTNACGEQPMAVYDTCRLLTQNLFTIVKNPFLENSYIDYDLLYKNSYNQLVLGDDLVDLECLYLQRIIDKIISDPEPMEEKQVELTLWRNVLDMTKSGRRVGCGITGLADMLAAINVPYDSETALLRVGQVMRLKMAAEYAATIDLSKQYGSFEGWDANLQWEIVDGQAIKGKNDFYQFLLEEFPDLVTEEIKYGRRNVNWSTIAPTGTTSIVCKAIKYANISSGCEPLFALWYFRNRKCQEDETYDYIDEVGIKWKTFPVMMGAFKDWIEIKGKEFLKIEGEVDFDNLTEEDLQYLFRNSPWYGSTADKIDWKKRVEMQAVLQKYTTSAISSTVNFPKDVKEETISELYKYAWEKGLKGITCYRDGSKGGVLVKEKRTDEFKYSDAIKRPKKLEADLHTIVAKGKKYSVIIGKLQDKPYEIFAFEAPEEVVKIGNLKGEVVKAKKGHYNFMNGNSKHTIKDIQIIANPGQEQMLTRLISGMLRHGAKPQFIMEQIDKCELEIVEFGSAIKRILKKYVSDEDMESRAKCSDCGSTNLKMQEGCLTCADCGSSKCG